MPQAMAMQLQMIALAAPAAAMVLTGNPIALGKAPAFAGLVAQLGPAAAQSMPKGGEPVAAKATNPSGDTGRQPEAPDQPATIIAAQAEAVPGAAPSPVAPAIPVPAPAPEVPVRHRLPLVELSGPAGEAAIRPASPAKSAVTVTAAESAAGPAVPETPAAGAPTAITTVACATTAASAASATAAATIASHPTSTRPAAIQPSTTALPPQPTADPLAESPLLDRLRGGEAATRTGPPTPQAARIPPAAAPPVANAPAVTAAAIPATPAPALPATTSATGASTPTPADAAPTQPIVVATQQALVASPVHFPERIDTAPAAQSGVPATQQDAGSAAPAQQVSGALVSLGSAPGGGLRMTLRLEPAELGQVQIRIDRPTDAPAQVDISVQRPETLTLLLRDQPQLQRALDQAGVPADGRSLTLHIAPPEPAASPSTVHAATANSADLGQSSGNGGGARSGEQGRPGDAADPDQDDRSPLPRWLRAGLDITA